MSLQFVMQRSGAWNTSRTWAKRANFVPEKYLNFPALFALFTFWLITQPFIQSIIAENNIWNTGSILVILGAKNSNTLMQTKVGQLVSERVLITHENSWF